MKVTLLEKNPDIYTCNSYLIRGNWNTLQDINTLIDTGTEGFILKQLEKISTGVGKSRIEQVILTHEHFDHAGGLKYILKEFKPSVLAAAPYPGVTQRTYDGMQVKIGDCHATIFHTPGHSNDSICIYCEAERTIFSGDTPLNIKSPGGSYSKEFLSILEKLNELKIERIYSGHDHPVIERGGEIIERSLKNVRNSIIV